MERFGRKIATKSVEIDGERILIREIPAKLALTVEAEEGEKQTDLDSILALVVSGTAKDETGELKYGELTPEVRSYLEDLPFVFLNGLAREIIAFNSPNKVVGEKKTQ